MPSKDKKKVYEARAKTIEKHPRRLSHPREDIKLEKPKALRKKTARTTPGGHGPTRAR